MQKTITTNNTDNTDTELDPNFILQAKIGMCPTLIPHPSNTANESIQSTPLMGIEETYAELPQAPEENQSKKQDDENPATQPDTQDDFQDAPQNSQATQSKGWASTLVSVPAKIASALNPLNWLPSKNTTTQPKSIIEKQELNEEDSSASLNKLVPDDSNFTQESDSDSCVSAEDHDVTGDDSNLQDN